MIRELLNRLKADKPALAPTRIWHAYEQLEKVNGASPKNELIALVSLIRRITGIDPVLTIYDKTVDANIQGVGVQAALRCWRKIHRRTDELAAHDQGAHCLQHPYRA